jgi:hypothetical protein
MSEIVLHANPMSRGRAASWIPEEVGVQSRAAALLRTT